jgi:hypothetical protein
MALGRSTSLSLSELMGGAEDGVGMVEREMVLLARCLEGGAMMMMMMMMMERQLMLLQLLFPMDYWMSMTTMMMPMLKMTLQI